MGDVSTARSSLAVDHDSMVISGRRSASDLKVLFRIPLAEGWDGHFGRK